MAGASFRPRNSLEHIAIDWGQRDSWPQRARALSFASQGRERVVHHHVAVVREEVSHAPLRRVGVDETSLKRVHHDLTLFVDLGGARVRFATEGQEAPDPDLQRPP